MIVTAHEQLPGGDQVRVQVAGEVDFAEHDQLVDAIVGAVTPGTRLVVLDFAGVTFFGSSGIRALIDANTALAGRGLAIYIDNCNPIVERALEVTGLREHFPPSASAEG